MKGIWAAVLTPIDEALRPDAARAAAYYGELLERGCDGINLLGTTGEAMSFDAATRMRFMEAIESSALPMERMMAGTGAASLADAIRLTRHAFDCNFSAALVMPPFFFREASDDGVVAFFDALFAAASPPPKSILLYNFPRMSGITFHLALVDRLVAEFPGTIAGLKDSSNDPRLQTDLLARHPELSILPGSESELIAAKRRGISGCISGSVALWSELAREVFENGGEDEDRELTQHRAALDGAPFIGAVRFLTAMRRGEPSWERAMPPNVPLTPDQRRSLDERAARLTR
ncbi:MAG TPA: dihydrodipicolinate synthase family protein [Candidatus Nitrosotalea sp.]|nr:dihydrodipicolinate synthase family protein [Candidatus Nitrosotalea sp.]